MMLDAETIRSVIGAQDMSLWFTDVAGSREYCRKLSGKAANMELPSGWKPIAVALVVSGPHLSKVSNESRSQNLIDRFLQAVARTSSVGLNCIEVTACVWLRSAIAFPAAKSQTCNRG